MSTSDHDAPADAPARSDSHPDGRRLGVLLTCFAGRETAGKTHRALEGELRGKGAHVLDTTVFEVDEKHKARTHDPRRVVAGTLTPILTWGVLGLLNGWKAAVFWGVLGGIGGYFITYYQVHLATKAQLAYFGSRLPANSSTLLTYAETSDSDSLLKAAASHAPSVVSVASIDDDLTAEVMQLTGQAGAEKTGSAAPSPSPAAPKTLLNMILTRYPDPGAGRKIADALQAQMKQGMKEVKKEEADAKKAGGADAKKAVEAQVAKAEAAGADPEVEVVIKTDRNGKRHVFDPNMGPWAAGKADIAGWAIFFLIVGLITGWVGNGFWGGVSEGIIAGILGGILGLGAGALYGLWTSRSTSAHRLRPVGPLLAPGTSLIVAWAGGALRPEGLAELATASSQQLVVHFDAAPGGVVLNSAPRAA